MHITTGSHDKRDPVVLQVPASPSGGGMTTGSWKFSKEPVLSGIPTGSCFGQHTEHTHLEALIYAACDPSAPGCFMRDVLWARVTEGRRDQLCCSLQVTLPEVG